MQEKIGFLTRFLGYELKSAERYRRFVSLVMVTSPGNRNGRVKKIIEDTIRNSDILADFDGAALVLMSETNSSGAITAIERYKVKNANQDDLRFSLVTYPSDGGGAEGLLATAFRRLQKATDSQPGSIVMTG